MTVILIVEDEVFASDYLEFVLQEAGYQAITTASADEAIEVLEPCGPIPYQSGYADWRGRKDENRIEILENRGYRWPPSAVSLCSPNTLSASPSR
jgi:DNA-binding NtrC family response regulator